MQQVPDTNTVIQVAIISQYLYNRSLYENRFLNNQPIDPHRPQLLYMVRKDVQHLYNLNPSDVGLSKISAYLFGLCAPFIQQALQIIKNITIPAPLVTGPIDQSVIAGNNATFNVSVSGSGPFTYQWYDYLGNPIIGATASSYTLNNAQVSDSGHTFFAQVTDANGETTTSRVATLTVTAQIVGFVYFGDTDYSIPLENGVDNVPYSFSFNITDQQPFNIQFPQAISSKFIVVKYPSTQPTKTAYNNPPIDSAAIPGFAFNASSISTNKYVFSRTGNPFTVNNSNILTLS